MISVREDLSSFIIDFNDFEDWEGFDYIISKFVNDFSAKVIQQNDGPESRVWYLLIDGNSFSLHNNPYGNYLKAESPESKIFLKNILNKVRSVFQ